MKKLLLLIALASLSACQPDTDNQKIKETNKSPKSIEQSEQASDTNQAVIKPESSPLPLIENPYEVVEPQVECSEPVVIEFFAYQCPHCYSLEPHAKSWKEKNADRIKFKPVPTHLGNEQFGSYILVHQAAKHLGVLDKAMSMLFHRLHEERKLFGSQEEAVNFLVTAGAEKEAIIAFLQDEEKVKDAIDADFRLLAKYQIASVPTILVNHKYKFNVTQAGGFDKVFQLVDETLELPSDCNKN